MPRASGSELTAPPGTLPRWLKLAYLGFALVLVPASAWQYGPLNLLWLSNIALLTGLVAVWLEHRFLASVAAVSVTLFEVGWIAGFVSGLLRGGEPLFGVTAYMFDEGNPLFVRGLALYHVVLPCLLPWLVWRLGYRRDAWRRWLPAGWGILVLSWLVTSPERNLNLAFGPFEQDAVLTLRIAWLAALLAASTLIWWITHLLLCRLADARGDGAPAR